MILAFGGHEGGMGCGMRGGTCGEDGGQNDVYKDAHDDTLEQDIHPPGGGGTRGEARPGPQQDMLSVPCAPPPVRACPRLSVPMVLPSELKQL